MRIAESPLDWTSSQRRFSMALIRNYGSECTLTKDAKVLRYMRERRKGTNQERAATRAGISVKTARKYERAGKLPSQLKQPRTWQTRPNPFEEDWPWVVEQLQRDPALQGATLFAELCQRQPGKYRPTQVRTLQRQIAQWRAQQGPEREIIFEQVHVPGERAQSDFTHMSDLQVTINGQAFPHLLYHFLLTHYNVEAVRVCFGETFEALRDQHRAGSVADRRCPCSTPHRSFECRRSSSAYR